MREIDAVVHNGAGEFAERVRACGRESQPREIGRRDRCRRGEKAGQSVYTCCARLAGALDQARDQSSSRCERHLLTQHRADSALEWIPRAWDADSRSLRMKAAKKRIIAECRSDVRRIAAEVEHSSGRSGDRKER